MPEQNKLLFSRYRKYTGDKYSQIMLKKISDDEKVYVSKDGRK